MTPKDASPVRNRIGWRERLANLRGARIELDLTSYDAEIEAINRLEPEITALSDRAITDLARELRARVRAGALHGDVRPTLLALAREASRRTLGLRPFDVQIVTALALDRGALVEMQTGEGKTLAAVMPAALHALTGQGVHVLTFNDYLARRDAEWMAPIYDRLGLTVGFVQQGLSRDERRRAYRADVTYVTAKEAGFDHLRDLLATDVEDIVHRPFNVALVDEADSILIDEARIPLVVAGSIERKASGASRLAAQVAALTPGVHFDTDEYGRDVELTEAGAEHLERSLGCGGLHDEHNIGLLTEVNCALHAHVLLKRDIEYIVRDGRIGIVDELTGRVVPDRHWPDGLQAALEAKEGLERHADGRILGSITLHHFLRGYRRLCGMTGTAQPAAWEISQLYGLPVVVVPTHRPTIRIDHPDRIFTHRDAKERALVSDIAAAHTLGRPVLVGTLTIEESERLAGELEAAGIPCRVLNAKNDEAEAAIIAAAGAPGAVTISTNMAGRGTDIRLGGPDEAERDAVVALGGLYVIGTNRHESRRVDLQLRGRAGRQGDPGESRFFVSLEDDLLVRYGLQSLIADRFVPDHSPDPIDHEVVRAEIGRAQRIVEGQNIEIRKTLWRYADIVESQRRVLMDRRQAILDGQQVPDIWSERPDDRATLVAAAGEEAVRGAERIVTLHHIDRAWRDHLSLVADVREGIHLVALGGADPLTRFTTDVTTAFHALQGTIERRVLDELSRVRASDGSIDLSRVPIKGPSSTWTYLVNDDPFRNQIGMLLTGPGRTTIAINAAAVATPLLILWGLVDRIFRRRKRRSDP